MSHSSKSCSGSTGSSVPIEELEKALESAECVLRPWIGSSTGSALLWHGDRREIDAFLLALDKVQFAVEVLGPSGERADLLKKSQFLVKLSVARMDDEFRHILETHSSSIDPHKATDAASGDSCHDFFATETSQSQAGLVHMPLIPEHLIGSLNEISTRMIHLGYGQSVQNSFRKVRRAVVDESLARLGLQGMTLEDLMKQPWDELEIKIDTWLQCIGPAIKVVFASERHLCNLVIFEPQLAESCFTELTAGGLANLFGFCETVSASKRSPEKLFRVLEMYEALRDLQPSFNAVFTSNFRCKQLREDYHMSLVRLSEAARGIFAEFENAIERDATKAPVPGGAVHGLTRYVVNYLILLYDYRTTLTQLFTPPKNLSGRGRISLGGRGSEGSEDEFEEEEEEEEEEMKRPENSALAATNRWKLGVLQRNLEGKAKLYKDPAQGQLFLMNNIHYIASKVKNSDLRGLLGDDWIRQQAETVRRHANTYQRMTWNKLITCLREDPVPGKEPGSISRAALKERFKQCNLMLEEIHHTQGQWTVPEGPLREELRAAITERILGSYISFYNRYARVLEAGKHPTKYIKYAPGDVEALIQDLFRAGK